jgi:hypothetical protein
MVNRTQLGWSIPTNELRIIAGSFHRAITHASQEGVPLPGDEWLDAQLRARGCQANQLAHWRARIRALRYSEMFESANIGQYLQSGHVV